MYRAFLYCRENRELSEKIKYYCKKYCIELFQINDLREMMIKGSMLDKYALYVDTTSVNISGDLINFMLNQNGNPKLIGIILLSKPGYNNIAIDCKGVYNVVIDESFAKNFVAKADILRDFSIDSTQSTINISNLVYDYLINLGLSLKYVGFKYIKDSIIYCIAQGKGVDNLSLSVYPYIASIYGTTVNNVERNVRVAIECSAKRNNGLLGFSKKPSNKVFLARSLNEIIRKLDKIA